MCDSVRRAFQRFQSERLRYSMKAFAKEIGFSARSEPTSGDIGEERPRSGEKGWTYKCEVRTTMIALQDLIGDIGAFCRSMCVPIFDLFSATILQLGLRRDFKHCRRKRSKILDPFSATGTLVGLRCDLKKCRRIRGQKSFVAFACKSVHTHYLFTLPRSRSNQSRHTAS